MVTALFKKKYFFYFKLNFEFLDYFNEFMSTMNFKNKIKKNILIYF